MWAMAVASQVDGAEFYNFFGPREIENAKKLGFT